MGGVIVENITKTFKLPKPIGEYIQRINNGKVSDRLVALDKVSFTVKEGEMFGVIGVNGSGKTTLLRTVAGIYKPDSGLVSVKGRMTPLLQIGTGFSNELNSSENIVLAGMLLGIPKSEMKKKISQIIEFAELQDFSGMKLMHYSTGMRARLAFSTALQVNADVLLVDEILAVGDLGFLEKSFKSFLSFKEKGKTILYSTHNLNKLPQLCDRVLLLNKGKVVMIDEPNKVIEKYKELVKLQKKE